MGYVFMKSQFSYLSDHSNTEEIISEYGKSFSLSLVARYEEHRTESQKYKRHQKRYATLKYKEYREDKIESHETVYEGKTLEVHESYREE